MLFHLLTHGSLCTPGANATEAEARKVAKCRELIDDGYIFEPMAMEVHGSLGGCSEIFNTRVCKMLCRSHNDQRAYSFLRKRTSIALLIGIAACVLGTVSDKDAFGGIDYIVFFKKKTCISLQLFKIGFHLSAGTVARMSSLLIVFLLG